MAEVQSNLWWFKCKTLWWLVVGGFRLPQSNSSLLFKKLWSRLSHILLYCYSLAIRHSIKPGLENLGALWPPFGNFGSERSST